jgi:hypothetical protein
LVTQSEYFDDASWSEYVFGGASLTRTFGYESPEGNNNAYKFDVVVGTGGVLLTNNITINPANAQTLSIWMKGENGGEKVMLALRNTASSGASGNVMTLTSEWARYDVTLTTAAADRGFQFRMLSTNGVVDQTIYVYGATLEEGSYPTSYIPTYGSSVTRSGEGYFKTGATDIIGQSQGSVYLEISQNGLPNYTQRILTLSDGTSNNVIGFQLASANSISFYSLVNGVASAVITKTNATIANQKVKIAAAYAENDFVLYIDGVQVGTDNSGTNPSTSIIQNNRPTGGTPFVGEVHQLSLFKTRLTNAELAALTTI